MHWFARLLLSVLLSAGPAPAVAQDLPGPQIRTVAGNGAPTFGGDGGHASKAALNGPLGVHLDRQGNLWIADSRNHRVRRVDATTGMITTVAGNGVPGYGRDGVPATETSLWNPSSVVVDAVGHLLIADRNNHRVRKVDATTGEITTFAGTGNASFGGDGGPAREAHLFTPRALALDGGGNLFIADRGNHRIRRVDAKSGVIDTIAGDGFPRFAGDGGIATEASLDFPSGLAFDGSNGLFIADRNNHRVRRVDTITGVIETVAGNGRRGYSGDALSAMDTSLSDPTALAWLSPGTLLIADLTNHRVLSVDLDAGRMSTLAGAESYGYGGDAGDPHQARLLFPSDLSVGPAGEVYIADASNQRIRVALPDTHSSAPPAAP